MEPVLTIICINKPGCSLKIMNLYNNIRVAIQEKMMGYIYGKPCIGLNLHRQCATMGMVNT
jgi:hypothetical protein